MATEREFFHECEVKRRRVRSSGGYESFWKVKTIVEALDDDDTEFRCKDCNGAVKLFKRRVDSGSVAARRAQAEVGLGVLRRRRALPQCHRWPRAAPLLRPRALAWGGEGPRAVTTTHDDGCY